MTKTYRVETNDSRKQKTEQIKNVTYQQAYEYALRKVVRMKTEFPEALVFEMKDAFVMVRSENAAAIVSIVEE